MTEYSVIIKILLGSLRVKCPDLAVLNREEAGLTNKKRGCCRSAVDKRVVQRFISP